MNRLERCFYLQTCGEEEGEEGQTQGREEKIWALGRQEKHFAMQEARISAQLVLEALSRGPERKQRDPTGPHAAPALWRDNQSYLQATRKISKLHGRISIRSH